MVTGICKALACRLSDHAGTTSAYMAGAQLAYSVAPSAGHDLAGHYECAKRIPAILEALQHNKLTAESQPQKVEP